MNIDLVTAAKKPELSQHLRRLTLLSARHCADTFGIDPSSIRRHQGELVAAYNLNLASQWNQDVWYKVALNTISLSSPPIPLHRVYSGEYDVHVKDAFVHHHFLNSP